MTTKTAVREIEAEVAALKEAGVDVEFYQEALQLFTVRFKKAGKGGSSLITNRVSEVRAYLSGLKAGLA